ncbi:hypothetical protein WKV44_06295 [Spirochaetia bacterium 38H-sp]|uniref:Lipoprotein n=1 Tax=Rarispira pelagica TaxID=3141764 RepID=A0ABU9UBV5_9SPIR
MKKTKLIIMLVLLVIIFFSCKSVPEDGLKLAFLPEIGKQYQYEQSTNMKVTLSVAVMGEKEEGSFDYVVSGGNTVLFPEERKGEYTVISYKFVNAPKISMTGTGIFKDLSQVDFSDKAMSTLMDMNLSVFKIVYDKKARISEIMGLKEFYIDMMKKSEADENVIAMINMMDIDGFINSIISNNNKLMEPFFAYFPNGNIKVGSSWSLEDNTEFNVGELLSFTGMDLSAISLPFSYKSDYIVSSLDMSKAKIEYKSTANFDIQKFIGSLVGFLMEQAGGEYENDMLFVMLLLDTIKDIPLVAETSGTYVLDVRTGMIREKSDKLNIKYKIDTSIDIEGTTVPLFLDLTIDSSTEEKLK